MKLEFRLFRRGGLWVLGVALVFCILASITPRHISTSNMLMPGSTYLSEEKLYWNWASSLHVEGIMMEIDGKTVKVSFTDPSGFEEQTFPLAGNWQTECPISEKQRQLLTELSAIEPIFAINELRQCFYLVLDDSHFLAENDGELYLVEWYDKSISPEIIGYIFRMVPETEYQTP